ncbi:proline-serine-threonine phosphatase interacting protein [Ascosphaera acerosa]|nr:proline-serine-threonine phosphatase interacting protein [Ascosphaera acerosa]
MHGASQYRDHDHDHDQSPQPGYGRSPSQQRMSSRQDAYGRPMTGQSAYVRSYESRSRSPQPGHGAQGGYRPSSSAGVAAGSGAGSAGAGMELQLSNRPRRSGDEYDEYAAADGAYGSQRARRYGASPSDLGMRGRERSRSMGRPAVSSDGRPILHYARALYPYVAAIPEEIGFARNEILAILLHQDDGWWYAELPDRPGYQGLVPSNYLAPIN